MFHTDTGIVSMQQGALRRNGMSLKKWEEFIRTYMESRDYIADFQLPGYTTFSCERDNRIGSCVILHIHSSLNPISIKTEPINAVDTVFIKLKNNSSRKILGLIYRPSGCPAKIDRLLFESISKKISQCKTIIMGDFNLPVTR